MDRGPAGSFFLKRLHSLTGVLPIGYYLIQHLALNFTSQLDHGNVWNRVVGGFEALPHWTLWTIEITVLAIPILYHAAFGIYMAVRGRPRWYPWAHNATFHWMRVSGVLIFLFLIFHVWQMTLNPRLSARELNFQLVNTVLSNPFWLVAYVVGVVAAVSHLAIGLWSFCITWGITVGDRSQQVSAWVFAIVGVLLLVIGLSSLQGFLANAPYQLGAGASAGAAATLPGAGAAPGL
ncbi:MAG: hypothetical protein QUU85_16545, partial [Candidatus Eisenbacteria bacterium]|nr:hypothetical protein [Candidatus Eisenbacteria bacterium]